MCWGPWGRVGDVEALKTPVVNPKILSRLFTCQEIGFMDEFRTQEVREYDFIFLFFAFRNTFFTHDERIECFIFRSLDANSGAFLGDFSLHAGNHLGEEMDGFGAIVQTLSGVSEDGAWLAFPTGLKVEGRAAAEASETLPILANLILPARLPWGSRPG